MDPFIGQILLFGGNFAPRGWAFCEGQLLPISSNEALFSILGTTYGGDGRTTFALPDLRGRVAIGSRQGPGLSNYYLGAKGGVENVTLTTSQIPSHTHTAVIKTSPDTTTTDVSVNNFFAHEAKKGADALPIYSSDAPTDNMNAAAINVGNVGGNQSHENRQPFLAVNYIIALQGFYPSRG